MLSPCALHLRTDLIPPPTKNRIYAGFKFIYGNLINNVIVRSEKTRKQAYDSGEI